MKKYIAKHNKSQKCPAKYAKKSAKSKIQIFSSASHSQPFTKDWVVEKDFTCARLGLLRLTQAIAVSLLFFSIPIASYLIDAIEKYEIFIVFSIFVTAIVSVALLINPCMIFRSVNWLSQSNIKLEGQQIELKIDNKIHHLSVLNIKKFKCYKVNNYRAKIEVVKIIIKMKDGSKFSLYQSTNFSENIYILYSVGVMIESILPDSFEKINKGDWLHRKETAHYADILTAVFMRPSQILCNCHLD